MISPARMVFPLMDVARVWRAAVCTKGTVGHGVELALAGGPQARSAPAQAKKAPKARGNLRGRADAETQGRGSRPWRPREVDQPWMPLRASETFERVRCGKVSRLPEVVQ